MKIHTSIYCLGLVASVNVAYAANKAPETPQKVEMEYQVTRNGQPFATVNERFVIENGRYTLESVTKGKGVYALFGKRVLTSEGEVTAEGLKPSHFEALQNNKKNQSADFDWVANTLTINNKGNVESVPLDKGAQDLASFGYQFMYAPVQTADVAVSLTTGRNLRVYRYKVLERDAVLETPAAKYKTVHLINASTDPKDDKKELWLGAENYHLPVRIVFHDDTGATIDQVLSSVNVE